MKEEVSSKFLDYSFHLCTKYTNRNKRGTWNQMKNPLKFDSNQLELSKITIVTASFIITW